MPRPNSCRPQAKDMYWFAHGGIEPPANQCQQPRSNTPGPGDTEDESSDSSSLTWKSNSHERRANSEEPSSGNSKTPDQPDASHQSVGLGKLNSADKRLAVEERRRQLQEAEQEKNEAILKKHAEREAALEARRNAQRSNISFAFGSAIPPNGEMDIVPVQVSSTQAAVQPRSNESFEKDGSADGYQAPNAFSRKSIFPTSWLTGSGALVAGSTNLMSQSMTGSISTCRGRRKNDLTPTVPYDRVGPTRPSAPVRKRSVSMSRLDILAQPRRPYVEAQKANSTMSSSSSNKDARQSPNRPLSAASEKAGGSGKPLNTTSVITRRPQTGAVRKSRPVSIAGSIPDAKKNIRTSTPMRSNVRQQSESPNISMIASNARGPRAKSVSSTERARKPAAAEKQKSPTKMTSTPTPPKPAAKSTTKPSPAHKQAATVPKQTTPKVSPAKKPSAKRLVPAAAAAVAATMEKEMKSEKEPPKRNASPARSASPDDDSQSADEKSSGKRIISEEEAKAALAEKRRLAREQAEKEAELERQRQEELKRQEEERLRQEEEEQRRMEEEQIRLLEEHRRCEEEKLKKAIEEQERKEEEEKARREEDARLKAEQEKRAKEEAEKQRIELEEKLRKEEEERAERKKRLEKIMSRTRGKSSGTASPSGSGSGSDQPDSVESQHDALSSELSSLESNAAAEQYQVDAGAMNQAAEQSSPTESLDVVNQTLYLASQSLSSNDLMIPSSGHTSLDAQVMPSEHESLDSNQEMTAAEDNTQVENIQHEEITSAETCSIDDTIVATEEKAVKHTIDSFGSAQGENSVDMLEKEVIPDSTTVQSLHQEVLSVDSSSAQQFEENIPFNDEVMQQALSSQYAVNVLDQTESLPLQKDFAESGISNTQSAPLETVTAADSESDVMKSGSEIPVENQSSPMFENLAEPPFAEVPKQGDTSGMPFSELDEVIQKNTDAELVFCSIPPRFTDENEHHDSDEPAKPSESLLELGESPQNSESTGVSALVEDVLVDQHAPAVDSSMSEFDEHIQRQDMAELVTCLPSPLPSDFQSEDSVLPIKDNTDESLPKTSQEDILVIKAENQDCEDLAFLQNSENTDLDGLGAAQGVQVEETVQVEDHDRQFGEPMLPESNVDSDGPTLHLTAESESLMTQSVIGGDIFTEQFDNTQAIELVNSEFTNQGEFAAVIDNSKDLPNFGQTVFAEASSESQNLHDNEKVIEPLVAAPQTDFIGLVAASDAEAGVVAVQEFSNADPQETIASSDDNISATHISIADELALHQINDFNDKNAFDKIPCQEDHQDDLVKGVPGHQDVDMKTTSSSSEMFLQSFIDGSLVNQQRTQNPFGAVDDVAFEVNKPMSHADVREELLVSSLSYADDSEGSSLDSNLSQILNVHSENVTNSEASQAVQEVIGNGGSSPDDNVHLVHQDGIHDTMETLFPGNNLSKSNGYTMNMNERIFDCRFESVDHKTDPTSVLSDDFHHPVNGKLISDTSSTSAIDNVDSVNSNKVASNPFLGASDSNPFAANPFQVPEEKTFTA